MSVAIVTTVGGSTANSYVTVAEATAYFAGRLDAGDWTDAGTTSPETQSNALVMAARRLDQERFKGVRVDASQALQWPRYGVEKPDLAYSVLAGPLLEEALWYTTTEIPQRIKDAQMELALALLKSTDLLDDTGLDAFKNIKVGPIDITPRAGQEAGELPDVVMRGLMPLLDSAPNSVRLLRG